MSGLSVMPITGIPEVAGGDDVAAHIATAAGTQLGDGDVVVIAHKIVSKAEGRSIELDERDAAIADESARILRRAGEMVIAETRHGFVCANAGVDSSNVPGGRVVLLPLDPDLSARRIRASLLNLTGAEVGVVISDTFGRAWRIGQTNVAIGVAGIDPFVDHRGLSDADGRELFATRICIADELAGAAEMVMGKALRIPAAIVRGAPVTSGHGSATAIARPYDEDLFR